MARHYNARIRVRDRRNNPLFTLTAPGKTKRQAIANVKRLARTHLRNIAAYTEGSGAGRVVHPIRGSAGYDPSKTTDKRKKSKRRKSKKSKSKKRKR